MNHVNRAVMALTGISALLIPAASPVLAQTAYVPLASSTTTLLPNSEAITTLPAQAQLHVVVSVAPRNPEAMNQVLADMYNPKSSSYHHFLTPSEFASRFGATSQAYQAAVSYLRSQGLTVTPSANRLIINATGPSSAVSRAFAVTETFYASSKGYYYAPSSTPSIPAYLDTTVSGVEGLSTASEPIPTSMVVNSQGQNIGLNNVSQPASTYVPTAVGPYTGQYIYPKSLAAYAQPTGAPNPNAPPDYNSYTPQQLAAGYNLPVSYNPNTNFGSQALNGAGQNIGIISAGAVNPFDVSGYEQAYGLSASSGSFQQTAIDFYDWLWQKWDGTNSAGQQPTFVKTNVAGTYLVLPQVTVPTGAPVPADQQYDPFGETTLDVQHMRQVAQAANITLFAMTPNPVYVDQGLTYSAVGAQYDSSTGAEYLNSNASSSTYNPALYAGSMGPYGWEFTDAYNSVVNMPNPPKVVSESWAAPEQGGAVELMTQHELLQQGAMEGITWVISSGDWGSLNTAFSYLNAPNVNFGASDPYVVGAGGSNLDLATVPGTTTYSRYNESAWLNSGGGYSTVFQRPLYQAGMHMFQGMRGVPDMSYEASFDYAAYATAGPASTTYGGSTIQPLGAPPVPGQATWSHFWGGTSYAAPQLAGLFALADQYLAQQGSAHADLGWVNPALYKLAQEPTQFAPFYDITAGSNGANGQYNAGPGWDPVTGWGTPNAWNLIRELGAPVVASAPGHVLTGVPFTISGHYFGQAGGPAPTVTIGGQPATVTSFTPDSITAYVSHPASGQVVVTANGVNSLQNPSMVVASASVRGYYVLGSDGGVFSFGQAPFYGSVPGLKLGHTVSAVSMATTFDQKGYWVLGQHGTVYPFGDAANYGDIKSIGLYGRVKAKAIIPTVDGKGYYILGTDGGVFTFGDATFYGSVPGLPNPPNIQAVSLTLTPDGTGYWILAANGAVYSFGSATGQGTPLSLGIHTTTETLLPNSQGGYWIAGSRGGVYSFGGATFYGSTFSQNVRIHDIVGGAALPDGTGYYLVGADGGVFSFGHAAFMGSIPGLKLNASIHAVGMAVLGND